MREKIRDFWYEWGFAVKYFAIALMLAVIASAVTGSLIAGLIVVAAMTLPAIAGLAARWDFDKTLQKIIDERNSGMCASATYCASASPRSFLRNRKTK